MPILSKRGIEMPPSPIRKLVPFSEAAKKEGRKVYHLNIGQPDIRTPQVAIDAIRNLDKTVLEYSHSAGYESYRRKLASFYQGFGINVDYSQIIVTTGGSEAILFTLMSTMDPGDELIIPEPFYANYNGFAVAAGIKVVPVTSRIEDGFALPPIEAFEKLITPRTKGILICNPNNPTGYLYSKEELEKLRTIVLKHNLYLFSDEVYREFCYDGATHHSVLSLEGLENHTVLFDSVSKRFSACGIRIGAIVSRNQELMTSAMKFAQARLSPPGLGQIAAEAALETPATYFDEVVTEYIARRNFLVDGLNSIPGVLCPKPKGAFYTTVRLPVDDTEKFAKWLLTDFSHENQTVMLAPASGFYATPGLGKDEVRIAYVLKLEDLKNALECLRIALSVYPGRK
ncbi:MAG: pyridoxal phosphate-dependent aminotransferase [Bacteroidales bacterium]|jgi:aspartate aminotransferase|nr:pyridoxal phosphate-dependent aminotransferase [Bacteroidales bacterium]MDD2569541.1 pyridoxal phosphate-dependent aminotransferase [Bacteroidales bacterium]MDD2812009.1 pyridoxal phosphate-dependent aminotransferase [Bacteroidales bacterium]MDD3384815.1 pyridoxal phosphate-dependent aminotransferase [Bacteroidales bacterium]MDD3811205.1 pyridoxal phosphate-dependent aminotransferase [Bacteroidales bacterium]